MKFETFDNLLTFVSQKDLVRTTIIVSRSEETSEPVVEEVSSYGTEASGYSDCYFLASPGQQVEVEHGGGDMPSIRSRFIGQPQAGFLVIENRYDGGFTKNYPPTRYTFNIILWGPEAQERERLLMAHLENSSHLTPLREIAAFQTTK